MHKRFYDVRLFMNTFFMYLSHILVVDDAIEPELGELPSSLCDFLSLSSSCFDCHSTRWLLYRAPRVCLELGRAAFSCFVTYSWNNPRNTLQLTDVDSLRVFEALIEKRL